MQSHHPSAFYPTHPPAASDVHHFKFFPESNGGNNCGLSMALSPPSPFGSAAAAASPTLFGHSIPSQTIRGSTTPSPSPLVQYNSAAGSFGSNNNGFSFSSMVMGPAVFEPILPVASGLVHHDELPSNQTPKQSTLTLASSNTSTGCEGFAGTNNSRNAANDAYDLSQHGHNSGLLDALLVESQNMSHKSRAAESSMTNKGKANVMEEEGLKKRTGETSTAENQTSSSQSSIGESLIANQANVLTSTYNTCTRSHSFFFLTKCFFFHYC